MPEKEVSRCPAKLNGNPPPKCELTLGHSGEHECKQPGGILYWSDPVTKPDDDVLRMAREIVSLSRIQLGLTETDVPAVAALIRTVLTERERELRTALHNGYLLAILLRTFADSGDEVDKDTAVKMGNFMREAERLLKDEAGD